MPRSPPVRRRGASGSRMWNVVPSPSSVSKVSVPPWRSTTIARAIARPWPVPRPTSLVVKKGSKIRVATSVGDAAAGVGDA